MKPRKTNRLLALVLCLGLLAGMFPLTGMTYAEETGCNHVHDDTCGYVEAVEGKPCTFHHEHDDACGYKVNDGEDGREGPLGGTEAKEAAPCAVEAAHVHDDSCGYVEAVAGTPCNHVHDASCGGLNSLGQNDLQAPPQVRASTIPEMNPKAVGFAGEEWWVIGKDGTGVNSANGTMTLLSKENLFNTPFDTDENRGGTSNSQYGGSVLQKAMEEYYNDLSEENKALILPRELGGVRIGDDYNATLTGDHYVWPLSKTEAESLPQDTIRANGSWWWLRSAYIARMASMVDSDGTMGTLNVYTSWGGRPALTLKLADVLFTSAAAGDDKSSATPGSNALTTLSATDTVKLTVKADANLALDVTSTGPITAKAGETVSFAYTGAKTGAGRSVSVLIKDKTTGDILCYGRPVDCESGNEAGTASFQLPDDLAAGDYTLLAFNEQVNGNNETDFASTPAARELKVEPKAGPSVSGVANGDTVYFAENEWFVIGLNGEGVNPKSGAITLLSKKNLFTTKFHNSSNEYGGSVLHQKMKDYYNDLSEENKALIAPRELDGVRVGDDLHATLSGNHYVWPLSRSEAGSLPDAIRANGSYWWHRSAPNYANDNGGAVNGDGVFLIGLVSYVYDGRPALTLNLDNAILATASAGEHGGISPSGKVVVPKNGSQTFTIKADEGYVLSDVKVNGISVGAVSSYTLDQPSEDCAIEASFDALNPTDGYDLRDVAVINDIIGHSSLGWEVDKPGSWPTSNSAQSFLKWDDSTPRRITEFYLSNISLTETLDVSGLTSLRILYCAKNSLTGLNVTGLSKLESLNCSYNSLTGLDVSGLSSLQKLNCSNNPIQSLKLPSGEALTVTVSPENSGKVMFSHNNNLIENKNITLIATAETGYTFSGWTDGTGETVSDNSFTFDLTGSKMVTANFTKDLEPITLPGVTLNGKVGFAGKEWWVIGLNKENDQVNPRNGAMTLLSKENLFNTPFDTDDNRGGRANNQYGGSLLQKAMEDFYNGSASPFLGQERALILPRALDDVKIGDDYNATLPGDHYVWPLSDTEAESLPQDTIRANGSWWWLRSASSIYQSNTDAYASYDDGQIYGILVTGGWGGRPAFTLNLDSVLFTSVAAGGGKSGAAPGSQGLIPLPATDTVKLTVKDDVNLALDVTTTGPITAKAGETVSFAYTGAETGAGRSVSVLIQNKSTGDVLCYGRPVDCESGNEAGTASFQLPDDLAAGDYTLLAFNEQVNGENFTDFASTPVERTLKVEPKADPITYQFTIQAGVGGRITQGTGGSYEEGKTISIKAKANAGYAFNGWTSSNGGSFDNAGSISTTFTMPANDVTVTANFRRTGGGSDPDPHTHSYGADWKNDAVYHWHECTAGDGARSEEAAHTAGSWHVDKQATENEAGSRHKECTVCGYVMQTESIAPTGSSHTLRTLTDPSANPPTGDTINMLPWVLLMLAALGGIGGLMIGRKKRKKA